MKLSVLFAVAVGSLVLELSVDCLNHGRPVVPQRSSIVEQPLKQGSRQGACKCGKPNGSRQRIVGGSEVSPARKYPWVISLMDGNNLICGGSIINDRWILTAAHCLYIGRCELLNKYKLSVWVGKHSLDPPKLGDATNTGVYTIKEMHVHKHYNCILNRFYYDVGLLKLTKAIPFNSVIKPICLPPPSSKTYIGLWGKVTGWGIKRGSDYEVIKELAQQIQSNGYCAHRWGRLEAMQMCVRGIKSYYSACPGDSGSPLVIRTTKGRKIRYVQVGVVSHGDADCRKGYPTVYARVTDAVPWIQETAWDGFYCS